MKFQYHKCTGPNNQTLYRPQIPIIFKYENRFVLVKGVIDSGSDCTILPIELASSLNLKLDPKQKTSFIGAGKNSFNVYPSPVKIEHILRQSGFRNIQWKSQVYFAESQPSILLGHQGFLENFKVVLDGKMKETEIIDRLN